MPSFVNPQGYTLLSVSLDAYITTTSSLTLQNTNPAAPSPIFPALSRIDDLTLNGVDLAGGAASFNYPRTTLTGAGSPGDTKVFPSQTVFNNNHIISYSDNDAGDLTGIFQGGADLNISYTSTTFINNVPNTVTQTSSSDDNLTFTITYNFCNPVVLSANILTFTAVRDGASGVLNWITANEQEGRRYDIEVSTDGNIYTIVGSKPSDPVNSETAYTYTYSIPREARGKLYFRLQQVETNGMASFSPVRTIDLGTPSAGGGEFSIYPNPPSDFINLTMPGDNQDWQVDIISADGSLVQRNFYRNSNTVNVSFVRRLAAGTYFARAVSPLSGKSYAASFLVR